MERKALLEDLNFIKKIHDELKTLKNLQNEPTFYEREPVSSDYYYEMPKEVLKPKTPAVTKEMLEAYCNIDYKNEKNIIKKTTKWIDI